MIFPKERVAEAQSFNPEVGGLAYFGDNDNVNLWIDQNMGGNISDWTKNLLGEPDEDVQHALRLNGGKWDIEMIASAIYDGLVEFLVAGELVVSTPAISLLGNSDGFNELKAWAVSHQSEALQEAKFANYLAKKELVLSGA
jgi:hypothetical protein